MVIRRGKVKTNGANFVIEIIILGLGSMGVVRLKRIKNFQD